MWVYDNDTADSVFIVDLTKDRDVQDNLPCNFLSVRNDSSVVVEVFLNSKKVGKIQGYSADSFIGKDFEIIKINQPDNNNFAIGDLFLQVGKNEQMSSMPFNPSWEMLEDNFDEYANGCNGRLSLSSSHPVEWIKSMINIQNSLIVQRRLDIQGSASLGTYEIEFNPQSILSGSAPINGTVLDTKRYKKTIKNGEFNYNLTNCNIKGWIIDLNVHRTFGINNITLVTGSNGLNAIDNDIFNPTDEYTVGPTVQTITAWEISFPPMDINEIIEAFSLKSTRTSAQYHILQIYNNSWVTVNSTEITQAAEKHYITTDSTLGYTNVTGLRVQLQNTANTYVLTDKEYMFIIS